MIAISTRALLIAKLPTLGAAAMKGGGAAGESTPITPLALHDLLVWLSVASGFIAALLWFYASSISVPTDIKSAYGALLGVEEMSAGFKKQARWNAIAAAVTGVAALFQWAAQWFR
jgi:hypothetical protein